MQLQPPPPPPREVLEEPRRFIKRAQKLGAKPYDGSGDLEVAWSWLDRVNNIYGVMSCTDDQRVLLLSFLMEDKAKDWWDAVDRYHGTSFSKSLLIDSFLRVTRIRRLRSSSD